MSDLEPKRHLTSGLQKLGLAPLTTAAEDQLYRYLTELKKWNQKINLVGKADDEQLIERHFIDSLTLLPVINKLKNTPGTFKLLDVGSGAGFPGLVLKIAKPDLEITLLEPRQKRVSFLKHMIRTLKLEGVEVIAERLAKRDRAFLLRHGQYSLVTSRALNEINEFLEMVENISPPNGAVLCMKGPRVEKEINQWQQASPASPFIHASTQEMELPFSRATRSLALFLKK